MIEGNEAAPGVWLFRSDRQDPNFGVVLVSNSALLVDPGEHAEQTNAAERFTLEHDSPVRVVVRTQEPAAPQDISLWHPASVILPSALSSDEVTPLLHGWQVISLADGMLSLHEPNKGILFCGEMLPQGGIPSLRTGAKSYLDALDKIENMTVKIALPARGTPATGKREVRARLQSDRNYIYATMRQVEIALGARISQRRAEEIARSAYEDYPFVEEHVANVRALWQELS